MYNFNFMQGYPQAKLNLSWWSIGAAPVGCDFFIITFDKIYPHV